MKKPSIVYWMNGILLFRLILVMLIVVTAIVLLYVHPESGFFAGFAKGVLNKIDVEDPYNNQPYAIGQLTALFLFPALAAFSELMFLNKRKSMGFWIAFTIEVLLIIGNRGFPFFSIVIFILAMNKSTRLYMSGKNQEIATPDLIDSDIE